MRRVGIFRIVCLALALFTTPLVGQDGKPTGLEGFQVIRLDVTPAPRRGLFGEWEKNHSEFEVWSHEVSQDGTVEVRVSPRYLRILQELDIPYEVVIADLQEDVNNRYGVALAGGNFFSAYRTNAEHAAFLQGLAVKYPELAQVSQIGQSVKAKPIWMIRITASSETRPGVLYIGAQHGNEATNPAILAYLAAHLLSQYGLDGKITYLLDELEIFIVPIANPDEYESNNRYNANGVDLNRDWSVPGATTPFSEPETAALRNVLLEHPTIRGFIDFHTFGYMILWPWGYTSALPNDHSTFKNLGDELAALIYEVRGQNYWRRGPTHDTLYPAVGTSKDYAYGTLSIMGLTIEVGASYAVSVSNLLPTISDLLPAAIGYYQWVADCDGDGLSNAIELETGLDCNVNGIVDSCENNHDGHGSIDACDFDDDNDGVADQTDACRHGPVGAASDAAGWPVSDSDGSCTVDVADFAYYFDGMLCLEESGPGVESPPPRCQSFIDRDGDEDVDFRDVAEFFNDFGGSSYP